MIKKQKEKQKKNKQNKKNVFKTTIAYACYIKNEHQLKHDR